MIGESFCFAYSKRQTSPSNVFQASIFVLPPTPTASKRLYIEMQREENYWPSAGKLGRGSHCIYIPVSKVRINFVSMLSHCKRPLVQCNSILTVAWSENSSKSFSSDEGGCTPSKSKNKNSQNAEKIYWVYNGHLR